tara:strand:- start:837 stop:1694 length:858 start_codon:yes stop_codon:yes gene_type:complete
LKIKDFFFIYKIIILRDLEKKEYFKSIRKFFNYPYRFLLNEIRCLFLIGKTNLDTEDLKKFKEYRLDEIFIEFNTDKGSRVEVNGNIIDGHNYSHLYEKYFTKYKNNKNLNILEIGSLKGAGTASFFNYFHNPKITCLDINPFQLRYFSKNIRKLYVDSQSKKTLSYISRYLNQEFDIIIDDGSHNIKDQIITLNELFPLLKKNGTYVIEDTCQYIDRPHLNPDNLNYGVNEFLFSIKKNPNHICSYLTEKEKNNLNKSLKNIFFEKGNHMENGKNVPEIVFIDK